jgi:hypothetical protein
VIPGNEILALHCGACGGPIHVYQLYFGLNGEPKQHLPGGCQPPPAIELVRRYTRKARAAHLVPADTDQALCGYHPHRWHGRDGRGGLPDCQRCTAQHNRNNDA